MRDPDPALGDFVPLIAAVIVVWFNWGLAAAVVVFCLAVFVKD